MTAIPATRQQEQAIRRRYQRRAYLLVARQPLTIAGGMASVLTVLGYEGVLPTAWAAAFTLGFLLSFLYAAFRSARL